MVAEITVHRRAFWALFAERHPRLDARTERGNETTRWLSVGPIPFVVAHYIGAGAVGIFVRGARGTRIGHVRELLFPRRHELAARLGRSDLRLGTTFLLDTRLRIDMGDRENWAEAADWLADRSTVYEAALSEPAGLRPTDDPEPWSSDFPLLP